MISRVAENCFWLHRYVERSENSARLLRVNRAFILDAHVPEADRWYPVLVVAGEHERFPERFGREAADDGELVQEYMTWSEENPVSILSSVKWARENARTIREVISLEMWQSLNGAWHWLHRDAGRRLYDRDRDGFYARVKEEAALFQGACHNTMLHDEPFDFMRLGMLLERAGQTARIIDVKSHATETARVAGIETARELAQHMALLRSCSATECYLKRVGAPRGPKVVEFLMLEDKFPRSVSHCLDRAWNFLRRIRAAGGERVGHESARRLQAALDFVRGLGPEAFRTNTHEVLTHIIDATTEVCNAVHDDYFDPQFDVDGNGPSAQTQSQS